METGIISNFETCIIFENISSSRMQIEVDLAAVTLTVSHCHPRIHHCQRQFSSRDKIFSSRDGIFIFSSRDEISEIPLP